MWYRQKVFIKYNKTLNHQFLICYRNDTSIQVISIFNTNDYPIPAENLKPILDNVIWDYFNFAGKSTDILNAVSDGLQVTS